MSTISDRKLDANRQNALKSTGPRTDRGKARSSQNARKHDVFCKNLVAPGENPSDFNFFKRDMLLSLNPVTCLELELAEQIIADRWRIKRVRAAENAAFLRMEAQSKEIKTWGLDKFFKNCPPEARRIAAFNRLSAGEAGIKPETGAQMLDWMAENESRIERLSRYEQRLQRSVYRALKELRELKEQEWPDELSELTIFLRNQIGEELEAEENARNEATGNATPEQEEGSVEIPLSPPTPTPSEDHLLNPENRDQSAQECQVSPPEPREAA